MGDDLGDSPPGRLAAGGVHLRASFREHTAAERDAGDTATARRGESVRTIAAAMQCGVGTVARALRGGAGQRDAE